MCDLRLTTATAAGFNSRQVSVGHGAGSASTLADLLGQAGCGAGEYQAG